MAVMCARGTLPSLAPTTSLVVQSTNLKLKAMLILMYLRVSAIWLVSPIFCLGAEPRPCRIVGVMSDDELTRQAVVAMYPPGPKRDRWLALFRAMSQAEPPARAVATPVQALRPKTRTDPSHLEFKGLSAFGSKLCEFCMM